MGQNMLLLVSEGDSREADSGHLENGLVLGLDALQEAGLREGKLGGGSLQVVVSLGLWHPLHKLRQVTLHKQEGSGQHDQDQQKQTLFTTSDRLPCTGKRGTDKRGVRSSHHD